MKHTLSESDLSRIRDAVADAEKRTSGEIVPYIVSRSANYTIAFWHGGGLMALLVIAFLLIVRSFSGWDAPSWIQGFTPILILLTASILGGFIVRIVPPLHRRLAGQTRLDRRVQQRALQAFVEREVFLTRERTGILLFVSLFEHRVEVIGDSGINAKVMQEDWADVVLAIRDGIKGGNLADGLVSGINLCGILLEMSDIAIRKDDINELSDDVAFGA